MKKNAKKKSTARKLLPAFAMLTVSAISLSSATYAWFTMNKEVQVTGMQLKTKVGSNLLISSNNASGTYKPDTLIEGRKVLLEPTSTITATNGSFFYTLDAIDTGQKAHAASGTNVYKGYNESTDKANALAGKYKYDATFNTDYAISVPETLSDDGFDVAYGYADYVFYLKATADTNNNELRMTQCDLNYDYNGADDGVGTNNADKSWRIAVFCDELADGQGLTGNSGDVGRIDPAASGKTAKTILKFSDSENWTPNKAVKDATSVDSVTYGDAAKLQEGITPGDHYYKVVVRIWLEGEDKTCNSTTYAKLTNAWTLDLDFQLTSSTEAGSGKTAVTNITQNGWEVNTDTTQTAVTTPIEVVPPTTAGT